MGSIDSKQIRRYTNLPFPAYAYIPGKGKPENIRPKANHLPEFDATDFLLNDINWKNSHAYLYAIDLFNHCYYWEVHEVLEHIWQRTGKSSETGIFLQGLIQISVALLKKKLGNRTGCQRLSDKAIPKTRSKSGFYLGIDVEEFLSDFKSFTNNEFDHAMVIRLKNFN